MPLWLKSCRVGSISCCTDTGGAVSRYTPGQCTAIYLPLPPETSVGRSAVSSQAADASASLARTRTRWANTRLHSACVPVSGSSEDVAWQGKLGVVGQHPDSLDAQKEAGHSSAEG